jgi:hypothetical protein
VIAKTFLRQVPAALEAGLRSGDLRVYGSTIRHVANGRIAGFLQETSGLARIANLTSGGPLAPLQIVGQAVQLVQNEQIKDGLQTVQRSIALLNQLQIANLALGAAGLGVAVIGFAAMNAKIDGVRGEVRLLGDRLDRLLDEFARDRTEKLEDMFDALQALAQRIESRWDMSGDRAASGWHRDADEADVIGSFFAGRARRLLDGRPEAVAAATPLLDAAAMASGLRVGALTLSGETAAAIGVANDDAVRLQRLTGDIGAADLARRCIASPQWHAAPGSDTAQHAASLAIAEARVVATTLRAREAIVNTRAAPLAAMQAAGTDPRAWLRAAREERDAPVLIMLEDAPERAAWPLPA